MCSTCTTVLDVAATNSVLAMAGLHHLWQRTRDRIAGRSRTERALITWEADAAFCRSLDLDPLRTLGAPPAVPTQAPAHDRSPATPYAGVDVVG